MLRAMPESAANTVEALVHKSRGVRLKAVDTTEEPIRFAVPCLAIRGVCGLQLFDRAHFLDIPWKLEESDPAPILDFFAPPRRGVDEAHVDVDTGGKVTVEFVPDLHQELALALQERGWTKSALGNWIRSTFPGCRASK
jgi:type III restriction enzyme